MDVPDAADLEVEALISDSLARFRHKRAELQKTSLVPEGYCHHCFEDVDGDRLFCNSLCASKYRPPQAEQRLR